MLRYPTQPLIRANVPENPVARAIRERLPRTAKRERCDTAVDRAGLALQPTDEEDAPKTGQPDA